MNRCPLCASPTTHHCTILACTWQVCSLCDLLIATSDRFILRGHRPGAK